MQRVAVVLHPARDVGAAVEVIRQWAADAGIELVQLRAKDDRHRVAPDGDVAACDLVAAVGGDGTTLTALHVAAATNTPVLGVAYGSLGALTTVPAGELRARLDQFAAGEWRRRGLPAIAVHAGEDPSKRAINDLVLVRRGGGQLIVAVSTGSDLYARVAGDGVVVATPLGSSAYSMAAGGPLLFPDSEAFVCTPLAMHGGCAPPLVLPTAQGVSLEVDPGYWGFDAEIDGHRVESHSTRFDLAVEPGYATLVEFDDDHGGLQGLRERGLIADSPRVLARDSGAPHLVAPSHA